MSPLFQWIEQSWLGTSVNNSLWAFAAFEAVHLLALAVIGGAVLVVDLRTLGSVFPRQRVADIAGEARPWLIGSVIAMFLTGIPLMASLAFSKYYFDEAFRLKMYFLARRCSSRSSFVSVLRWATMRGRTRGWQRRWQWCRCCCGPASASWDAASGSSELRSSGRSSASGSETRLLS